VHAGSLFPGQSWAHCEQERGGEEQEDEKASDRTWWGKSLQIRSAHKMRINTHRKWVNPPIYGNSPIFFCTMETAQSFLGLDVPAQTQNTLHILSGSFRSISLFLLAFSPANRSLSLVQTVDAFGPHQYLALNPTKDRAFATTWTLPPSLSSWEIDRNEWKVNHINNVPISE